MNRLRVGFLCLGLLLSSEIASAAPKITIIDFSNYQDISLIGARPNAQQLIGCWERQSGSRPLIGLVSRSFDTITLLMRLPRHLSDCEDAQNSSRRLRRRIERHLRLCAPEAPPAPRATSTPVGRQYPHATPIPISTAVWPVPRTATPTWAPTPLQIPTVASTRTPQPTATRQPTRLPQSALAEQSLWESQMVQYGRTHCQNLNNPSIAFDPKLAATYYDAASVFYKIADYTGDSSWIACAQSAEAIYRDRYALPASGVVPGYWNFTRGLTEDYLRTGDEISRQAAILLSRKAAFASDTTSQQSTADAALSREVAYAILSYLDSEDLGEARRARLSVLVNQAFGHCDQWFVSRTAPYVKPFMVALTAQALIAYHDKTGDSRVVPALSRAADWLWDNTWLPQSQAFRYATAQTDSGGMEPAADLNLLIAPFYGWLYKQTGEARFRERGDQIFRGGVVGAYLSNGKQFNQNYRWSFEYLEWRK